MDTPLVLQLALLKRDCVLGNPCGHVLLILLTQANHWHLSLGEQYRALRLQVQGLIAFLGIQIKLFTEHFASYIDKLRRDGSLQLILSSRRVGVSARAMIRHLVRISALSCSEQNRTLA